jgi:hypothetical protein
MDERLGAMAWTLATSGMRPAEYWHRYGARWIDAGEFVSVEGTKTSGSVRKVPLFRIPDRPECAEKKFRGALDVAGGIDAYDLRRTYANWLESAGIARSRRRCTSGTLRLTSPTSSSGMRFGDSSRRMRGSCVRGWTVSRSAPRLKNHPPKCPPSS